MLHALCRLMLDSVQECGRNKFLERKNLAPSTRLGNGPACVAEKLILEREFYGHLNQSWSSRADDLAEMRVVHFPVDRGSSIELGMIERVECLQPELKRFRLGYSQHLVQRHVKVTDSGAIEKSPRNIPQLPKLLGGERGFVERRPAIPRIGVNVEPRAAILRRIQQIVVDTIPQCSEQRVIRVVEQSHGQAGSETGGIGDAPAIREAIGLFGNKIKRKIHLEATHKV